MKRRPLVGTLGINTIRSSNPEGYDRFEQMLNATGFDLYLFEPDWQTPDPRHWARGMAEYATGVSKESRDKLVLFGFSAGAVAATLATVILEGQGEESIAGLAACSLSPWFGAEQVQRTLQTPGTALGKQPQALIDACRELELPEIDSPIQLYVGTQEHPLLRDAHEAALERWLQAESIEVPDCKHNMFDPAYIDTLQSNLGRLAV